MIWDKWLGSRKSPEEQAAHRVAKMAASDTLRTARADRKDKRTTEQQARLAKKRKVSIEKAIIAVTDRGFVSALVVACFVAYALDMIFFFQQTPIFWLSCLLCAFGFVIRTIAICGGVVLEWAEEDESKEKPDPLDWQKAKFVSTVRWFGRRMSFSTARMTLRITTWLCWMVCAYATVSFFGSGHEMRKFAQESITAMESVQVVNAESVIADIRKTNEALDSDKDDIRADRDRLIEGARTSISEAQKDGSTENDNLDVYERNIARYNTEADAKIATKDGEIAANNQKIVDIQSGKGGALVEAAQKREESPPFLAVYTFLASITGWTTDNWTIWSALLFSVVFELIVDTGLKNYFRLKKRFTARLRTIEMRQVLEDAEWDLSRFNTITAANLAKAKAMAEAKSAEALQQRELAELTMRTERELARTEAARMGVPWLDPVITLNMKQKLAEAESDKELATIESDIRKAKDEAELLRNPPPPPPPPPAANDEDEETELERRRRKQMESRKFNDDMEEAEKKLKVPTEDWRNRMNVGV